MTERSEVTATCSTCQHWGEFKYWESARHWKLYGECAAVYVEPEDGTLPAAAVIEHGLFITLPTFGCILHQPQETP